jgi:hypothetical protein
VAVTTEAAVVMAVTAVPAVIVVIVVVVVVARGLVIPTLRRMTAVRFLSNVRAHAHDLTCEP